MVKTLTVKSHVKLKRANKYENMMMQIHISKTDLIIIQELTHFLWVSEISNTANDTVFSLVM